MEQNFYHKLLTVLNVPDEEMQSYINQYAGDDLKQLKTMLKTSESYIDSYYASYQITDPGYDIAAPAVPYLSPKDMADKIAERAHIFEDEQFYAHMYGLAYEAETDQFALQQLKWHMDDYVLHNINRFKCLVKARMPEFEDDDFKFEIKYTSEELQQICLRLQSKNKIDQKIKPVMFADILLNKEKGQITTGAKKSEMFYIAFKLLFKGAKLEKSHANVPKFAEKYFTKNGKVFKIGLNDMPKSKRLPDIDKCFEPLKDIAKD